MFVKTFRTVSSFTRISKLGQIHNFTRSKTVAVFICDACDREFERDIGSIDHKRLSNDYHHVCSNCDSKRFAQKKGAEKRRLWNMPVDADIDISKI